MTLQVRIDPIPELPVLAAQWQRLSALTPHSFFQSWTWLETWLQCLGELRQRLRLLSVLHDEQVIGTALLCRTTLSRRRVMPVRTWLLTATGDERIDGLTIEYNDLLVAPDRYQAAWRAIAAHFHSYCDEWDELRLDGVPVAALESWRSTGLPMTESRHAPSRYVRLAEVRQCASQSVLELLAPRVRTRIRRTQSGLESRSGPLQLQAAATPAEASEYLEELLTLHRARWESPAAPSTFCSPFSLTFHRQLIDRALPLGAIQLLRLRSGARTVGVLYNFVHAGKVYFYQSGIDYAAAPPNESPGLLLHVRAVDFNAGLGHERYDFLAGDSQYKRSLAQHSDELCWLTVQAPRIRLRMESVLKRHYRRIRYRSA